MKFWVIFISSLLSSPFLYADWVQVTGKAPYSDVNYDYARSQARDDAYKQAIMLAGTRVTSEQRLENGVMVKDNIELSSQARVKRAQIQNEYVWKNTLHLVMDVEIESIPLCQASQASDYKKKVAVLGFSLQVPDQARMGGLDNVNRGFASALSSKLHRMGSLVVYENSQERLAGEIVNAPTLYTQQNTLTKAASFAKDVGVQFVVSGVVRDLGVESREAFTNSYWHKLRRAVNNTNQKRRMTVDLFVHDGFSGAIVWQRTFTLSADWKLDATMKVGFGSAEFWQSDYGRAVNGMLDDMALLIEEQLRCQPFMTRIARVDGKVLHFNSGASTGIRPGDKLSVYRTFNFHDADRNQGVELTNVKTALTVSQVHPGFASGTINVDPGRLNIQEDDLLIAW